MRRRRPSPKLELAERIWAWETRDGFSTARELEEARCEAQVAYITFRRARERVGRRLGLIHVRPDGWGRGGGWKADSPDRRATPPFSAKASPAPGTARMTRACGCGPQAIYDCREDDPTCLKCGALLPNEERPR